MNNTYRFTSDNEPTEQQLELLMNEVTKEVKKRAAAADLKFKAVQKEYFVEMTRLQKLKLH